jgi:NADPH:quinone reductase-like Zn-dependent oxidoreductase
MARDGTMPAMKIRAIAFQKHGGPDVLEELDVEIPDRPAPGMVRVRILAVALNHLDLWIRRGLPNLKLEYPHRLGADIAATIEAVGEGASAPPVGTRVLLSPGVSCGACEACLSGRDNLCRRYGILGEHTHGGYGELLDVPAANILPWPGKLEVAAAASIPLTFLTAWQMVVDRGEVARDHTVLVHAAGAGVSVAAIQIAKSRGARVIATSTSASKLERARALGADEVIDSTKTDFVAEVKRLTNKRGADLIIEHVGGEIFAKSILALATGGRMVTCGATAGFTPTIDLRHVFFRQLSLIGSTMGSKGSLFAILREVERGALQPVVDRVLPFTLEGAREAHRVLEAREAFGKVVLRNSVADAAG